MTTALALRPLPLMVRPAGLPALPDPIEALAGAWGRAGTAAQTSVDAAVARQADVALDRVMARAPAAGVLLQQQVALAVAQGQRAATQAAHDIAADALRQASAALLAAEPWLRQEVLSLSASGGQRAANAGLGAIGAQLTPYVTYAIGAVLVGVAVYLATERRGSR